MDDLIISLVERLPHGMGLTLCRGTPLPQGLLPLDLEGDAPPPTPTAPPTSHKEKDAAREAGIPFREIQRARKSGYLAFDLKKDGRDAGAILIDPGSMEQYMVRRAAVESGREDPPEDWPGPGGRS